MVSLKEAQAPYALYDEEIPFEDKDLLATSFPFPVYKRGHQRMTEMTSAADAALLEGLREARLPPDLRAGRAPAGR